MRVPLRPLRLHQPVRLWVPGFPYQSGSGSYVSLRQPSVKHGPVLNANQHIHILYTRDHDLNTPITTEGITVPRELHQSQYTDAAIASVEMVCGDGFMSPGGEQCVARIVEGLAISGKKVLEVGCGLGGVLVALVRNHHAGSVHGMDLETSVLERAKKRVLAAGLEKTIRLQQVMPGPFPVDDDSFDFVVCKEMLCHIEDKKSFYAELVRVIKPGGWLIGSDWLISNQATGTPAYESWRTRLKDAGLIFHFASFDETVAGFGNAGLENVQVSDNFDWINGIHDEHHERVHGSAKQALLDALGNDGYEALVVRTQNRIEAVKKGMLLHCNFRAQK